MVRQRQLHPAPVPGPAAGAGSSPLARNAHPGRAGVGCPGRSALPRAARPARAETVALGPLGRGRGLADDPGDGARQHAHRRPALGQPDPRLTAGNPFYIIELLKTMFAQGLLAVDEREWRVDGVAGRASRRARSSRSRRRCTSVIAERVERLPEPLNEVLITVATAGAGCRPGPPLSRARDLAAPCGGAVRRPGRPAARGGGSRRLPLPPPRHCARRPGCAHAHPPARGPPGPGGLAGAAHARRRALRTARATSPGTPSRAGTRPSPSARRWWPPRKPSGDSPSPRPSPGWISPRRSPAVGPRPRRWIGGRPRSWKLRAGARFQRIGPTVRPSTREIVGEDLDLPVRANAGAEQGGNFSPAAPPHRDHSP